MKNSILLVCSMIMLQLNGNAQCDINYEEILDKYCDGTYLMHYELNNQNVQEANLILNKEDKYLVYFLNPNHAMKYYHFYMGEEEITDKFDVMKKNTALRRELEVGETGEYSFSLKTDTHEEACVLMAVYLDDFKGPSLKAGLYKSFEELRNESPSELLQYDLKKVRTSRIKNEYYYVLKMSRAERLQIGEIVGFSDGKDFYMNYTADKWKVSSGTRFVKVEDMGRYYYFTYTETMIIPIGTYSTVVMQNEYKKLLDLKTGEDITLTRKRLEELIAGDPELLKEFRNESRKSRVLKGYVVRYLERNPEQ